jgi:hypothetical protein
MYKVLPFNASIPMNAGADAAASQLESVIIDMARRGYEFTSMESIPTFVAGSKGCFGIGATSASSRNYPVVIFRQK